MGSSPSEDDFLLSDPVHDLAALLNLIVVKGLLSGIDLGEGVTVDDDSIAALKGLVLGERATIGVGLALEDRVELLVGVGDHVDLDTSSTASLHRHVDLGPGRVIEGDEADKS